MFPEIFNNIPFGETPIRNKGLKLSIIISNNLLISNNNNFSYFPTVTHSAVLVYKGRDMVICKNEDTNVH